VDRGGLGQPQAVVGQCGSTNLIIIGRANQEKFEADASLRVDGWAHAADNC
jgi:hypothetical protein